MVAVLSFFIVLFYSPLLFAVEPIVNISVSPQAIGTNETAEIRITIINEKLGENPQLSAVSDKFTITYRGISSQRELTIINNQVEVKMIYSYLFQFVPHTTGKITIPTFLLTRKNSDTFYSPSTTITVEETDSLRPSSLQRRGGFSMFFDEPSDIFLKWNVTRDKLPQNTGFIAYLYLFSDNHDFISRNPKLQQVYSARFDGGLVHGLVLPETNNIIIEQFGLRPYYGKIIARYLLFPLEKGSLMLHPPVYRFQRFNVVGDPVEIQSIPITKSLTYIGDEVSIDLSLSSHTPTVSEEQSLIITIEGDGNVDFFVDPLQNLSLSNLFISFPTNILELGFQDELNSNQIYMKKTFFYTLIPQESETFTIPPITLTFADNQGTSTNTTSDPLSFTVLDNSIKPNPESAFTLLPENKKTMFYSSGNLIILFSTLLGFFIILGTFFRSKEITKLATDHDYARKSGADKRVSKIMSESEQAIKNHQYKDAARLIRQSILYFCTDRLSIDSSSSPQQIIAELQKKDIDFPLQKGFLDLMNELDFHAFASTPTEIQIKGYLSQAYHILDTINKLKIK